MPRKEPRVVIDTNIWVSFLIGKELSGLDNFIIDNRIQMLLSDELLEEMSEVLHRPRFQRYFTLDVINEFVALLIGKVEIVEITETFDACRDPKDNFLLDLCVSVKADYLMTGDEDLLVLNPFKGIQIIDYNSFQSALEKL